MQQMWLQQPRHIIGMMSGTSLDGIDICLSKFWVEDNKHRFELLNYATYPMDIELKELIVNVLQNTISIEQVSLCQKEITKCHADIVDMFLKEYGIDKSTVDLISVHGQTMWHAPSKAVEELGHTLQLLSVPALAALTQTNSIGDFRTADIALGGQGAPLVPIFDSVFLHSQEQDTVAVNIGGMANLTFIPKDRHQKVIAFDCGPGNILIDESMQKFFGKKFDNNGSFAREGKIIKRLWENLCELEFINENPPKSTGREFFNRQLLEDILEVSFVNTFPGEDIVRTVTEFTAWSIAENIRLFTNPKARVLITGGGALNPIIMERLQQELQHATFVQPETFGINSDAKEALCFAYMGWRTLAGLPSSLASVTGAKQDAILGSVSFV